MTYTDQIEKALEIDPMKNYPKTAPRCLYLYPYSTDISTSHPAGVRSFTGFVIGVRLQETGVRDCHAKVGSLWFTITAVHGPFGRCSSYEKVQKASTEDAQV